MIFGASQEAKTTQLRASNSGNVEKTMSAPLAAVLRNGTLQVADPMMPARALGLDCGPMPGLDEAAVNLLFPQGDVRFNFLCDLGDGDASKFSLQLPRLSFSHANTIRCLCTGLPIA